VFSPARLRYEDEHCLLQPVEDFEIFDGFCCGDDDLNEFIKVDAKPHYDELLSVTYSYHLKHEEAISPPVAFASLLNDTIRQDSERRHFTKSRKRALFPQRKRYKEYPAVKIGRLAVDGRFQRKDIGTSLLTLLKQIFITSNRTGCRFLTVDAYRTAIRFYEKNDFSLFIAKDMDGADTTVSMYFDLMRYKSFILENARP